MKKLTQFLLILIAVLGLIAPFAYSVVSAEEPALLQDGRKVVEEQKAYCRESGAQDCETLGRDPAVNEDCRNDNSDCNLVAKYVNPLINSLAILLGIAVVIGVIMGGIQYASSGGDPQKAATGKKHIKMAAVALIGYFLLFAFLEFMLPGGVLTR